MGRCDSDGDIFQRTAEASHGMAFKMGQHQHGIIIFQMSAHKVLLNLLSALHGQFQFALFVHDINFGDFGPAVLIHGFPVSRCRITFSFIGRVALHNRAVHLLNHGLPEVRPDKVLISHFPGMQLDCHLAGKICTQRSVQPEDCLRCDVLCKIHF